MWVRSDKTLEGVSFSLLLLQGQGSALPDFISPSMQTTGVGHPKALQTVLRERGRERRLLQRLLNCLKQEKGEDR